MMRRRLYESEQKYFGVTRGIEPVCFMGDTAWDLTEILGELSGRYYDHNWFEIMKSLRRGGTFSDCEYQANFDESDFIFGPVPLDRLDYGMVDIVCDLVNRGNSDFDD